MRLLLFFSRVALVCNVFFLICFSLQMSSWIRDEQLSSTVIVIGYVLGFIINPLVNLSYFILFLVKRSSLKKIPSWIITANILFLVIQILYILYLNDTQHS